MHIKNNIVASGLLWAGLMLLSPSPLNAGKTETEAQKETKAALDIEAVDKWERISAVNITNDGKVVSYEIRPQSADGRLVFHSDKKEKSIPRGCNAILTNDGRHAWFRIRAPKGSKEGTDSLGYINLKNFKMTIYPSLKSFSAGEYKQPYCAYLSSYRKDGLRCRSLIIPDPESGKADTLRKVTEYSFSKDGTRIAAVVKTGKENDYRYSAYIYEIAGRRKQILTENAVYCSCPSFSDDARKAVFLVSRDTVSSGRNCALMYYSGNSCRELLPQDNCGLKGWRLTEKSRPVISPDNRRIFMYISENKKSTNDKPGVAVWRYNDPMTPPQCDFAGEKSEETYRAVLNLNEGNGLIRLTSNLCDEIKLPDGNSSGYALSIDRLPYMISESWAYRNEQDLYSVDLSTGKRKMLAKGLSGFVSVSPDGKHAVWSDMDSGEFYSCSLYDGKVRCLTENTGVSFFIEDNDRPRKPFPYCTSPLWTEDGTSFLISDRYDIWQFALSGEAPINLTAGTGRKGKLRFKSQKQVGKELFFTILEEESMRQGIGKTVLGTSGEPTYLTDTMSFSISAAAKGRIAYLKGNFATPEDLYLSDSNLHSMKKISDNGIQIKGYSWGTARQLSWKAYDGTPLKGVLYIPDNATDETKCPMIVYFYERKSETLYDWSEPALSRSRISIPYMVSNGYAVFVPDIVYGAGHPGKDAYNCIISGTEAVCRQFSCIDSDRLGIDGQSWGGYQSLYLITQTDIFKAAGAGAPVSNMTSAYGGIRWESGVVRAWQYERDQSRIGKSLWEDGALELYIENSPLFFADKVHTPLLMISNDADGAVPWYQGIEMFSALRRLDSPVWMLQYKGEGHNLTKRANKKDLTVKMMEFFDHYLKGAPQPEWMKSKGE